jgi:hypothetical protein
MGNSTNLSFELYLRFSPILSFIFFLAGIIIISTYFIKKSLLTGFKDKYNFISRNEKKMIWFASIFWLLALLIYPRYIVSEAVSYNRLIDFAIILVLCISLAFAIYYILRHYYPDFLNKRLNKLRYKPRISPSTGQPMKLLSEEEEDVYLDEGMIAEENVFSVDYDVWIDEETGYTQIEKYSGKYAIMKCPKCGYQTLKIEKEELLIAPSNVSSGELLKRYRCTYCNYTEKEIFHVAKLREEK